MKTYILNEISLIVPCYNEQESLPVFFNEINKTMKTMGCTYELLFVDDGSSDNTLEKMIRIYDIFHFQEILAKKVRCMQVFAMHMVNILR